MNIFIIENERIKDVEAFFDSVQLSESISAPSRTSRSSIAKHFKTQ